MSARRSRSQTTTYASGEHRGAMEYSRARHPRGRRNSLRQADIIHQAPTAARMAPARGFTSNHFEGLRHDRRGDINIRDLISTMHPTQEQGWDPAMGQGRRQIRTGRNFLVPDADHPGEHFRVRVHTNDNTRTDQGENAYSHAVLRIERTHDNRVLMGGRSHRDRAGVNAWAVMGRRAADEDVNAAHIPGR